MKLYALGLFAFTCTAAAQSGDWARLQSLRHNSTLIVETDVTPYGPANFNRCHLKAIDATTLTCTTLGWAGKRVVFPAGRIDAVYRVKQQTWLEAGLGVGAFGTLLGGVLAGCASATGVGLFAATFWVIYETSKETGRAWHNWWYGANPMPENERRDLVYLRPSAPAPTN